MPRLALCAGVLFVAGCQLLDPIPPVTPAPEPTPEPKALEPGPLPPEETPPPEQPPAAPPAEAKPVEPGITSTGGPTRGSLPKAVVDEKLKSAQPGIQRCYDGGLAGKPDLRGNVLINFVVGPDGKVAHVEAGDVDEPLDDQATVQCIVSVIQKLEFPEPKGGRVFLNYPIKLEATKPAAP
jgi:hypothetical protein